MGVSPQTITNAIGMETRAQLEARLADRIGQILHDEIEKNGKASLLVSGGSTPKGLFEKLSGLAIPWDNVTISLVDDRFVADNHPDQNGTMVKELLLQQAASNASFVPLISGNDIDASLKEASAAIKSIAPPYTIVILGVGEDGHTASIFPDSEEMERAISVYTSEALMVTNSRLLPYSRITFALNALLNSKHIFVHCYGVIKGRIIDEARQQEGARPYPIAAFLNQTKTPIEVYWTE